MSKHLRHLNDGYGHRYGYGGCKKIIVKENATVGKDYETKKKGIKENEVKKQTKTYLYTYIKSKNGNFTLRYFRYSYLISRQTRQEIIREESFNLEADGDGDGSK